MMTLNLGDLWHALRSRQRLIATIAATVFALIAILTFIQPRQYAATSSLLIDLTQTDQNDNTTPQSTSVIDSIVGTQISVVKSALVLDEVVRRSGLVDKTSDPAEVQRAEDRLAKRVQVEADRQSNVIRITYLDKSAERAARVANLFADVFIQKQVELRVAPARSNEQWFDARTAEVRRRYEAAQRRLTDFQRAHGVIGIDRMDLEADNMKNLSTELVAAEAAAAQAHSKAGSTAQPEVSGALSVQGIEQQVAQQAAHVAELGKTLGPNHPDMKAAEAQLATLRQQLGAARGTQASSLSGASSAASKREADIHARLAAQQEQMIRLSGVQDQLMVLQRDVDAAKLTYDTVRQRFNDAALKSEVQHANTSVLDHADVPILPAKPNVILWLFAGILLGLFAGIGTALALELTAPRVRSATGLAKATDIEVLADFTTPTNWHGGRLAAQA